MALAIHTRYHGPTDTKGARISATCRRMNITHRVYVPFAHELDCVSRHHAAARALIEREMAWAQKWDDTTMRFAGETLDGNGYVFAYGAEAV